MLTHPLKGALFETFVIMEILKARFNHGQTSNLYYFRDNIGNEVDLVLDCPQGMIPVEIKFGKTVTTDSLRGLRYYNKVNKHSLKGYLIYGGDERQSRSEASIVPYRDIGKFVNDLFKKH